MALNLYADDLRDLSISREYPYQIADTYFEEKNTALTHDRLNGLFREIYFEGVHIGFGDMALREMTSIHFNTDFETVEMHFSLRGERAALSSDGRERFRFRGGQHNIVYTNQISGQIDFMGSDFKFFEINMQPRHFRKFFPEDSPFARRFFRDIEQGKISWMFGQNPSITPSMERIIRDIMSCDRSGWYKRMFIEAKVMELLLLQMEQLESPASDTLAQMRPADVEKMYAVKEFIEGNLDAGHSLTDLAREVGTNEFALKKGFKTLFGTTVFGFWSDLKMEEARRLLQDYNKTIGEVSELVGYKNPQHFSTAFKRRYGILPSHVVSGRKTKPEKVRNFQ